MGLTNGTPRAQHAAQLAKPLHRVGPEPQSVDGEDGVKRIVEARQLLDRGLREVHAAGADGGGVATGGMPDHGL